MRLPLPLRRGAVAALAAAGALPALAAPPRAEIQVGLCGEPQAVARALDLVPRAPPYDTWLFDDASLSLQGRGVRLRLRMQADAPVLTVKVADQDCRTLPKDALPRGEGKCEYDVHGAAIAGAVSLEQRIPSAAAAELIAGKRSVATLLSPAQRRYLRDVLRLDPLPPDLRALGPIATSVFRTRDRRYDVDQSTLPVGAATMEISIKVPLAEVTAAQAALDERLAAARVARCEDQSGQAASKLRSLVERTAPKP
ncbi:MAG: hypothetical protein U1F48_20665 [Burkholderiales bacterium]